MTDGADRTAEVRRTLVWLIGLRAGLISLLLGVPLLLPVNLPGRVPVAAFVGLLGLTYGLTALYGLLLRRTVRCPWIIDVQLLVDVLIVTAIVSVTGGAFSDFSSLYVLPVIAASILRSRRGGLKLALLSATAYMTVGLVQYGGPGVTGGVLAGGTLLPPENVARFTVGLNVFGFVAVGALSGHLSETLRRTGASLAQASSQIANLQALNQHIIESLTSGLVTADASRRIKTFNRAAEQITGYRAQDVIGRAVAEILQLPASFDAALQTDPDAPRTPRIDYGYCRPEGRRIDLGLSAAPLVGDAGPPGLLFIFQDLTDIKRLERDAYLQQRLAAVGEMAAGIAHEIRNPLASMAGSIQVLRQELPLTEDQAQLMDIVLRESERLNHTIKSFLAYARPQRATVTALDLRNLVRETAALLRHNQDCRDVHQIELGLPPAPVRYEADEGQIRQIIWNLATNSLRAMPDGGRLTLDLREEAGDALLVVTDTGVGIPPEDLDRIFQPFVGQFGRGTGLGLAIVHRIVSDYSGEIHITSDPGVGTAVTIRLPAPARVRAA